MWTRWLRFQFPIVLAVAGVTGGWTHNAAAQAAGVAPDSMRLAQPNAARFPEVTLYAYPTDARGLLVTGLGREQFRVVENGRPAEILRVESAQGSLDICLALDRSMSMADEDKAEFAKTAAREFVRQLAPEDQVALITFADHSTLDQGLTRDREPLLAAIDRANPTGNSTAFLDSVYWSITQVALRRRGGGNVISTGAPRAEARRVVVALTDGMDLSSRVGLQELVDYARANGVSLCMVALGQDAMTGQMDYLSRQTGGVFLRAPRPGDLERLYASLAEQLRREYHLTIRSPHPEADATRRVVRVELTESPAWGETWYQAPGQGSLLVTVNGSGIPGPGEIAAPSGGPPSDLVLGSLLLVLGIAGTLTAVLVWMGTRRRQLAIPDSNPRIDLLPLWVRQGSTWVGRGAECGLRLDSQQVSRVHARIDVVDGAVRITDERSRNGTYVNGRRIRGSQDLRVGDVVRFGDKEFRFAGELAS